MGLIYNKISGLFGISSNAWSLFFRCFLVNERLGFRCKGPFESCTVTLLIEVRSIEVDSVMWHLYFGHWNFVYSLGYSLFVLDLCFKGTGL